MAEIIVICWFTHRLGRRLRLRSLAPVACSPKNWQWTIFYFTPGPHALINWGLTAACRHRG